MSLASHSAQTITTFYLPAPIRSIQGMESGASPVEKIDDGSFIPESKHMEKMEGSLTKDAARGTEIEHELTFTQAAKKYPAAIGWTVIVCMAWYAPSHSLTCLSAPSLD